MYTAEDRAQIRRAAEAGVADSQYQLGVIYEEGKGVKQDFDEAVKWYRAAAEQGFSEAQYTLGFMYADGVGLEQDDSVAVEWWLKASENGHPMAQCNLGGSYFDAIGVPEDRGEGLKWLQRSAEQGQKEALSSLELMQQDSRIPAPPPGTAVTTVLLTADRAAEHNNKSGTVVEAPSPAMARPGVAFVLLDGETKARMFKAMNLQINA